MIKLTRQTRDMLDCMMMRLQNSTTYYNNLDSGLRAVASFARTSKDYDIIQRYRRYCNYLLDK